MKKKLILCLLSINSVYAMNGVRMKNGVKVKMLSVQSMNKKLSKLFEGVSEEDIPKQLVALRIYFETVGEQARLSFIEVALNPKTSSIEFPLGKALNGYGIVELFKLLLEKGANPNKIAGKTTIKEQAKDLIEDSPGYYQAIVDQEYNDLVKKSVLLVKCGADPNEVVKSLKGHLSNENVVRDDVQNNNKGSEDIKEQVTLNDLTRALKRAADKTDFEQKAIIRLINVLNDKPVKETIDSSIKIREGKKLQVAVTQGVSYIKLGITFTAGAILAFIASQLLAEDA